MTLRADPDKIPVADFLKVDRRIERSLVIGLSTGYGRDVEGRWTVAHLAANSRLTEDELVWFRPTPRNFAQLAGMADCAVRLIVGRLVQFLKVVRV